LVAQLAEDSLVKPSPGSLESEPLTQLVYELERLVSEELTSDRLDGTLDARRRRHTAYRIRLLRVPSANLGDRSRIRLGYDREGLCCFEHRLGAPLGRGDACTIDANFCGFHEKTLLLQ